MVGASKWDTVHRQTLRCEGLPYRMYSGDRHPIRARARCYLYRSPCRVPQLCDAESLGVLTWVPEGGGTHLGARVGKWAQADGDVRTSDAR
eukprot:2430648-Prymnesium_polylepis.1